MLVDQDYSNVLSFSCKLCERLLYLRSFGLMVDDEEVPLCIGRLSNVADTGKQEACDRTSVKLKGKFPKLNRAYAINEIDMPIWRSVWRIEDILFISNYSEKLSIL